MYEPAAELPIQPEPPIQVVAVGTDSTGQADDLLDLDKQRKRASWSDAGGYERVKKLRPIPSAPFAIMGPLDAAQNLSSVKQMIESLGRDVSFLFFKGFDVIENHVMNAQVRL